jgi:flagellar hook-length control protein FliK
MDLQTVSASHTAAAQSAGASGAPAADKAAALISGSNAPVKDAQGNLVAFNESGAGKPEFAAILQQMFGEDAMLGNPAVTLNAVSLLAGILPDAPILTAGDDTQDLADGDLVANNPQLLDQLMTQPKFQLWLDQAAVILQSLNLLPGPIVSTAEMPDTTAASQQGNPQLLLNAQQAQTILAVFQAATAQTPGNPQLQQLAQSFTQLMDSLSTPNIPKLADTKRSMTLLNDARIAMKSDTATATLSGNRVDSEIISTKVGNSAHTVLENPVKDTSSSMQAEAKPKSLLHFLAAKTMSSSAGSSFTLVDPGVQVPNPLLQPVGGTTPAFVQPTVNSLYFTRDMTQFVMNQLHIVQANGVSEATITLYPQHLGQVDVKLTMQDGILAAQFTAGTALGKDLLENQLPQLRAALQTQGLQVDKLVVNQSASLSSGMFQGQTFQQQSQFNQQSKNRQRGMSYEGNGDDFSIELTSVAQMRASAYGNSFDVTA